MSMRQGGSDSQLLSFGRLDFWWSTYLVIPTLHAARVRKCMGNRTGKLGLSGDPGLRGPDDNRSTETRRAVIPFFLYGLVGASWSCWKIRETGLKRLALGKRIKLISNVVFSEFVISGGCSPNSTANSVAKRLVGRALNRVGDLRG